MGTALLIYGSVAHALGGYNLSRFLASRAIKFRRARKAERARDEKINTAVDFIEGAVKRFKSGETNLSTVQEVLAVVEKARAFTPEPPAEAK